ncbi:MAG TPA: LysM peptidoglycan-binding domain-containing protein [Gammaproteobacteria bacterium]|nr:LysM peptidoglycan-binding domain-containing protein [Gammaproteobacteria bacterium]
MLKNSISIFLCLSLLCACTTTPQQDISRDTAGTDNRKDATAMADDEDVRAARESLRKRLATRDIPEPPGETADSPAPEHADIWARIRSDLRLQRDLSRRSTQERLSWYSRHQDYLDRVADRATPYIHYIVEQLEARDMPLDLALLPVVESAYQPFAHSPSRASGIWQFIPGTGRLYGLKQTWWYDGRRDIVAATGAALDYLQKLHAEFNGDWLLALAAYNTGERNVARAIERNRRAGKPTDFWSLRLARETRGYVPSLLAVSELVASPAKYNITLKTIPNEPYFRQIDVGSQIDLATVSELSELDMETVYRLNPGINNWATDPHGPHHILVPVDIAEDFRDKLSGLPDKERVQWKQHKISKGDTLSKIAAIHRTDVATLKQVNRLRGNTIRAGGSLLIPAAKKPLDHYTLSLDARRFRGLTRSGDGERYLYTVQRGDNLWDISRAYGVSVRQLCAWNGISPNKLLHPGNKLVVWVKKDSAGTVKVASRATSTSQKHISYTVKEGDSLWLISRRYGVSVKQLQKWNSLGGRSYLKPGQNLDIYLGTPPSDA